MSHDASMLYFILDYRLGAFRFVPSSSCAMEIIFRKKDESVTIRQNHIFIFTVGHLMKFTHKMSSNKFGFTMSLVAKLSLYSLFLCLYMLCKCGLASYFYLQI